jgi:hypothetical protein
MANEFFNNLFSQQPSSVAVRFPSENKAEENRLERERQMFMSNPNRVEQIVSALSKQYVPFKKQEKLSYGSNLAKVDAAIPSDDPRKGMGSKVLEESNLAIFLQPDKHPLEVIKNVYDQNVEERKVATYKYLDQAQKPFLGIPFTGKTVGKDVATMPGYEEYRKKKEEYDKTHFSLDEMSTPQAAAFQGSVLAGMGMVAEKLGAKSKVARVIAKVLPTAFKEVRNPMLRLGLTAAAAIPEFWAFEGVHQLVSKSDQLKDQPEIVKQGAGMVAGALSMGAVSRGIAKYSEAKAAATIARNTAATNPTIDTLLEADTANKKVGSALAIIEKGTKLNDKGWWEAGPSSVFKNVKEAGTGAVAAAAKPRVSEEMVDRILGAAAKGEPIEQAAGRIVNQDKLLTTLDNIKGKKFFDSLVSDKNDAEALRLRNRLFKDAIADGASPEEAAVLTQKGMAKTDFDDLLNQSQSHGQNMITKHTPDTVVGLRNLGYSDDTINQLPTRMGKKLVARGESVAAEEVSHAKFEGGISETLHSVDDPDKVFSLKYEDPALYGKNKAAIDVIQKDIISNMTVRFGSDKMLKLPLTDNKLYRLLKDSTKAIAEGDFENAVIGKARKAGIPISDELLKSEVSKFDVSGISKAKEEVAKAEKLLGKETSKIGVSPKYIYGKGEPAANASEKEWYDFFSSKKTLPEEVGKEAPKDISTLTTKQLAETPTTPEAARTAYSKVVDERKALIDKRVEEETVKHNAEIAAATKELVYEPAEAFKAITSEFVSDEQFAKSMKALEVDVRPLSEIVEGKAKKIKGVATPSKVAKVESSVDFNKESTDLYNRMSSGNITSDEYDSLMDKLVAATGKTKMLGLAIGAGALTTLASILGPTDANAAGVPPGVVTNFTKDIIGAFKKTSKEIMEEIVAKKLWVPDYVKGSFEFGDKGKALSVVPSIMNVTRKKRIFGQDYMSPNVVADFLYNTTGPNGAKLPTSPMPEIAHRTSIAMAHTAKSLGLIDDVMKSVTGGESHMKEVSEAMKPLLEMNNVASKISFHKGNIDNLEDVISGLIKKKAKLTGADAEAIDGDIYKIMQMQDLNKEAIDALKFDKQGFEAKWRATVEPLAQQYPSTRIALALDGEGMSAADPWVLNMLTDGEKEAVGHIHRLHNKIAEFIIDSGGEPILSKPYIHHASHPDFNTKQFVKDLEGYGLDNKNIMPLAKLHHRSFVSKQMMPDLQYVEQQYFPDIFKRIEMMDFWKKGKSNGWAAHTQALEQLGWRGPADFMHSIERSFAPEETTTLNTLARQAYSLEAARLIGMNPSPGFKHLMKLEANWSNFGFKAGLTNIPKAFDIYRKDLVSRSIEKLTGKPVTRDMETELYKTFTHAGNISAIIQDFGLYEAPKGWLEKFSRGLSNYTGGIINNTERFDRAMSFVGSMEMAAKQGMTAEQSIYSLYDTILKTNFLSGTQNPAWLRNPKVRAMAMFQGTPFKIAEQRALLAWRAGKSYSAAAKETWNQMQNLRGEIKEGEQIFKFELIKDALEKEKDIYGIPYAYQLMRKIVTIGTLITGGAALFDADMVGHTLHLPFVKKEDGLKLNLNPVLSAAMETSAKEDEFWVSSFFKKWMGSGVVAATKASRFYEEDIPQIYRGSRWRYFFGVPASKEEK